MWIIRGSLSEGRPTEDYLPSRLGSTPAGDTHQVIFWGLEGEFRLSIIREMSFNYVDFFAFFLALLFVFESGL